MSVIYYLWINFDASQTDNPTFWKQFFTALQLITFVPEGTTKHLRSTVQGDGALLTLERVWLTKFHLEEEKWS